MSPHNFTVEKLMIVDVHCIAVDMTVKNAIGILLKNKISGAPVLDSVKKVITIVSSKSGGFNETGRHEGPDKYDRYNSERSSSNEEINYHKT